MTGVFEELKEMQCGRSIISGKETDDTVEIREISRGYLI